MKNEAMDKLEEAVMRLQASRDQYKLLYEKERDNAGGKVVLREADKTKLLYIRDYIDELLGRWDKLGEN